MFRRRDNLFPLSGFEAPVIRPLNRHYSDWYVYDPVNTKLVTTSTWFLNLELEISSNHQQNLQTFNPLNPE